MTTLTKEQIVALANAAGFSKTAECLPTRIDKLANAAFALGVEQGIKQEPMPLNTRILAITTAYEQGFGKGESRADVTCPYTAGDWLGCDIAWNLGNEEGRSKPAKQQVEQEPVAWWMNTGDDASWLEFHEGSFPEPDSYSTPVPLYTSPPAREQVAAIKTLEHLGYTF